MEYSVQRSIADWIAKKRLTASGNGPVLASSLIYLFFSLPFNLLTYKTVETRAWLQHSSDPGQLNVVRL
ncbi:hypothetical protein BDV27DRAFT_119413 [Aspergillus caelatus]|uniref:Uncharacterized protein n=2 Tax=Aspergillus subgen. Circumdati TaxID=2720871 RepID=A0A5N7AL31_9EURO|nr:uncharacterized protein BDV27DRAFT_119413 [Aspergillus caelatus]KAE8370423.1 hypothetical protein BDV27DRAFT_119413 [Aspergillus caelatus]KAE8410454.1 hypothetical protein BDV36DRAFT_121193 [Aspergillus pseudocaelatus]